MKHILPLLLLLLSILNANGQNNRKQCNSAELDSLYVSAYEYIHVRDYERSISTSLKLIDLVDDQNCYYYLFKGYNLLSVNYLDLKDTVPSVLYSKKALHYAKMSKNDTLLVDAYNNLAALYTTDKTNWGEAMQLYKKSLALHKRLDDGSFANAALNIAELYRNSGNYDAMPDYLREAALSLNEDNIKFDDPRIYLNILWGDYFYEKGEINEAFNHYQQAYLGTEKDSIDFLATDFYGRYAQRLRDNDQHENAYEIEKRLHHYELQAMRRENKESLLIAKAQAQVQEYKRQRNEAKLQQQLADQRLQRKKSEGILLAIFLFVLILLSAYLYRTICQRKVLILELRKNNIALKDAKESAEQSVAAKERFFSTLSHEMRTPLYGVTGIVSLLENSNAVRAHRNELQSLKFSAGHLLDIINDLLDISKLDNNTFELQNRPFNIRTLVKEIVSSIDQYAASQNNKVHLELSALLPNYLIGDSRRLSQVLLNILSNSMKFTRKGDIWIKVSSIKREKAHYIIQFVIEDNGKGMDKESQKYIFKEFGQIETGGEKNHIGTGLGMSIVKRILERMKSSINVESELGVGTSFQFSIRFEEATLLDVIKFSSSQKLAENRDHIVKGVSFLIVDDNKINRMVTSKILIERGARTEEAQSGLEALEKVKKNNYDLILMDINMPGMNGFETTQALRNSGLKIPIIALTAAEASYMEKMIKTYGMNGAIIKPYSMDEFMNVLSHHLDNNNKTISL